MSGKLTTQQIVFGKGWRNSVDFVIFFTKMAAVGCFRATGTRVPAFAAPAGGMHAILSYCSMTESLESIIKNPYALPNNNTRSI